MPSEPSFQICSPAFSIEDIGSYSLQLELHNEALRFVVFQNSDLVVLEEHTFDKKANTSELISKYREIIEEHTFLKANYWSSIAVFTDSPLIYPISKDIFDINQIPTYEKLIFHKTLDAAYAQYETHETVLLMAYDSDLQIFTESIYPNKDIKIQAVSFKMAQYFNNNLTSNTTILHFSKNHVTAFNQQFGLQTFSTNAVTEIVLREQLNTENCILYGQITTFHPLYKKLKSTFKNLSFGALPPTLKVLSFMADLPTYKYMSLLV
jgi:Protein of unknown function (DUF3822)